MKRLIICTSVLALLLIVASQCGQPRRTGAPGSGSDEAVASAAALDVGRAFLTALLTGDVRLAARLSTPLMAVRLIKQGPVSVAAAGPAPSMELVVLAANRLSTDIAAELHWPGNRLAALRLRLVWLPAGWRVGEVQP